MVHQAEVDYKITVTKKNISKNSIHEVSNHDVVLLRLPNVDEKRYSKPISNIGFRRSALYKICSLVNEVVAHTRDGTKILVMGNPIILPYVHECLNRHLKYRTWIVVKTTNNDKHYCALQNEHDGILVYTKGTGNMHHSIMRVRYEYCKSCDKTVKDYGGKKHLYHEYGTALSDVWKDFSVSRMDEFPKKL